MHHRHPVLAVLALAALSWLIPASSPAQIRDDQDALKTLKVPDGFEIRLFAGSDICHNPTALDVDIYGRVWVTEGMNYRSTFNKGPGPKDPDGDRIKVYEDTDGDGKADKVTVFADKLRIVPMTVCVAGDRVFSSVAPDLLTWDGGAGKDLAGKNKSALLTGFGSRSPDHDHILHGLTIGPDGRLYFAHGDVGFDTTDKSGVRHRPNGGSMVRLNLDGTKMHVIADNLRNPYELSIDSFGRVFCSDNDDDGNAQVRICYIIDGADYGYRHNPKLAQSPTRHHWREDVPGVTPKILRTFAGSPCGILTYEGKLLPERFHGMLIHCDNGAPRVVRAYHLKPEGAGFKCEIEDLVTSTDTWFRPADVAHAADGSLYIADWYDSNVGGHGYRDKVIGRIYHLTMKGAPPPAKMASPDLQTIPGQLSTLMSPVPAARYLAIQKLREGGAPAVEALTKMAREGKHPLERARATWVLFTLGEPGRPVVLDKLKDSDPRFRAMAVRMLREDVAKNLDAILPLARDDNPEVRLEVVIALRDVPTEKARTGLYGVVRYSDPKDPWYAPALARTLRTREPELIKEIFAGTRTPDDEARMLTLAWQLNRSETVPFLTGVLKSPKAPEHGQKAIDALSWISDISAGETLAAFAVSDTKPELSRSALAALQRKIGGDWKPLADQPVFGELFDKSLKDPARLSQMLALIGAAQAQKYVPRVLELIDQPGLDKALRRSALEALGQIRTPATLAKLEAVLKTARLPEKPPAVQPPTDEFALAALTALNDMGTPEAGKIVHATVLDRGYPADLRRQGVKLLGQTPAGCRFLLNAAEKGQLPIDLKGDATQVTNHSPDGKVRALAAQVLPLPRLADNRTLPPLKEILGRNGDTKRGQAVFLKKEAQCAKCHRVDGNGAWVGPDLSQIGGKLGKEGMLDAILNPSAAIAHEYVQFTVETNKGQTYAGLIVEETPERLVLKNNQGERIVLPARDIAGKTGMSVSIMPDNLVQSLSDQNLVDLLAYLATLRQPSVTIPQWQSVGPFAADVAKAGPEDGIDLKATYAGKGGTKVGWRPLNADREGRLDLEAALGTRAAAAYLYTPVQSKAAQDGRIVVLLPAGATVTGWINGKAVKFQSGEAPEGQALVPAAAELSLKGGKNELLLKIVGSDKAALAAIATLVSPQGVELAPGGK